MEGLLKKNEKKAQITSKNLDKYLGVRRFDFGVAVKENQIGQVVGLAWTEVGGDLLTIEAVTMPGKGGVIRTGTLGDVMKESALTALSYLRAHSDEYGIDYRIFDNYHLHIHVPAGAVPKDGPSAGITMTTSIASALTQRKVKPHLAMTGEVTLRGKVLPVGGIKEKILAAKRAGIKEIILCNKNKKDIEEITPAYISDLTFHYVDHVDEVLKIALLPEKVSKPIDFIFPEEKKENVLA